MLMICLMVRENLKMVREMSGKSQGILWGLMGGHPEWQKWRPCKRSRSKVKVTEVTTQLYRFRTVTPVWIHVWWWNDAYSLIMLRRGALLFLAATKQLYKWYFPSVRPSVRLSVTPFWLCSHHCIIMKFSGVITNDQSKVHARGQGQRSRSQRSQPNLTISGL